MKTFTVSLYCKNCHKDNEYLLPVGTKIIRAPYLGYENTPTRVIIPHKDKAAEHKELRCQYCEVGNVA